MLLCACSVIDRRSHRNVLGTSVTYSFLHRPVPLFCSFQFPHFDVICDQLLNTKGRTAILNLYTISILPRPWVVYTILKKMI